MYPAYYSADLPYFNTDKTTLAYCWLEMKHYEFFKLQQKDALVIPIINIAEYTVNQNTYSMWFM